MRIKQAADPSVGTLVVRGRGRPRPLAPTGLGRFVVLAAALSAAAACDRSSDTPLEYAHESPEQLVEAVLEAVQKQDGAELRALLVSREEFERYMWPVMPDRENTQLDFFWGTMAANSRKGVRQLEHTFGGVPMEVVSITMPPPEEVEAYEAFSFHTGVRVVARRLDTGEEGWLPSFDGFVDFGGGWKLLNYDEL